MDERERRARAALEYADTRRGHQDQYAMMLWDCWMAAAESEAEHWRPALERFRGLLDALEPSYPDEVIIRCEVTAADLRALKEALGSEAEGEK